MYPVHWRQYMQIPWIHTIYLCWYRYFVPIRRPLKSAFCALKHLFRNVPRRHRLRMPLATSITLHVECYACYHCPGPYFSRLCVRWADVSNLFGDDSRQDSVSAQVLPSAVPHLNLGRPKRSHRRRSQIETKLHFFGYKIHGFF